jgi:hypothetical protein
MKKNLNGPVYLVADVGDAAVGVAGGGADFELVASEVNLRQHKRSSTKIRHKKGCRMEFFQTKNPNLGQFWRPLEWKIGIFYGHLVCFTATWQFGIFSPVLEYCVKKNTATLH